MEFINCTGHSIDLVENGKKTKTIPASKYYAYIKRKTTFITKVSDWPIYNVKLVDVVGLPRPVDNRFLIVSASVAGLAVKLNPTRKDLLIPRTLKKNNKIQGCSGFVLKTATDNVEDIPGCLLD